MTNFQLRPWQMTDLPDLVRYANNWNVAKNLMDKFPHPYTEADGSDFIAPLPTAIHRCTFLPLQ